MNASNPTLVAKGFRQSGAWVVHRRRLKEEIEACLAAPNPLPVNLSLPKHTATAPVLREFAYDQRYRGRHIPVVFMDGSKPPLFPIGCFYEQARPQALPESKILRVGLMSFRHPQLDYLVDLYITRNCELADEPTMAEEENLAFERTVAALSDPVLEPGGEMEAYHTGLEPMVVGFYRGVVQVLRERQRVGRPRRLLIRPRLYAPKGEMAEARHFDRTSPGADPNSYESCEPWW